VRRRPTRDRYHHGDLRAALLDTAIELIAERGVPDFSMAEASRRLGVAVSAPYRHFTDREELLTAVGVRACQALVASVEAELAGPGQAAPPGDRLAGAARGYVRFAAEHPPLFEVLFTAGGAQRLEHAELERAMLPVKQAFQGAASELTGGDPVTAEALAVAVAACAHGHAGLLLTGAFGPGHGGVEAAVTRAGASTLALIAGRAELLRSPR
jgi:AcrR family transcriptional regulator